METVNKKNEKFITTDELQKQLEAFADELGKAFVEKKKQNRVIVGSFIVVVMLAIGVFSSSGDYDTKKIVPFNPLELSTLC